ncbi:hypothetical protein [Maridesulfovibrio sp. FT414]|uniref:hypothetical protein n=1 Tax=Maridesulfovibrio sp. FT414 TaxID=2979469 RepID=UPI003D802A8F
MKFAYRIVFALLFILVLTSAATAASTTPAATTEEQAEFRAFAAEWVSKLNRSHIKGFHNMEIQLLPDGSYLARYHHIDPATISCRVKKTSSSKKGSVGLLKYIETIYESTGLTPQKARNNPFKPVKSIRITEIFSNTGKGWR